MKYLAFFSGILLALLGFAAYIFVPEKVNNGLYILAGLGAFMLCGWAMSVHEAENNIVISDEDDKEDDDAINRT